MWKCGMALKIHKSTGQGAGRSTASVSASGFHIGSGVLLWESCLGDGCLAPHLGLRVPSGEDKNF